MTRKQLFAVVMVGLVAWTTVATSEGQDSSPPPPDQQSKPSFFQRVGDWGKGLFSGKKDNTQPPPPSDPYSQPPYSQQYGTVTPYGATTTSSARMAKPSQQSQPSPSSDPTISDSPATVSSQTTVVSPNGVPSNDTGSDAYAQSGSLALPDFPGGVPPDQSNAGVPVDPNGTVVDQSTTVVSEPPPPATESTPPIAHTASRWDTPSPTVVEPSPTTTNTNAAVAPPSPSPNTDAPAGTATADGLNLPLYERLKVFRESAFSDSPNPAKPDGVAANHPDSSPADSAHAATLAPTASASTALTDMPYNNSTGGYRPVAPARKGAGVWTSDSPTAVPISRTPVPPPPAASTEGPTRASSTVSHTTVPNTSANLSDTSLTNANPARPSYQPMADQPITDQPVATSPATTAPAVSHVVVAQPVVTQPVVVTPPAVAQPVAVAPVRPIVKPKQTSGILLARQGPALTSETVGPRRISVGLESVYQVLIQNSADAPAEGLVLYVDLPAWAEVAGATGTIGSAQAIATGSATRQVQWKIGRLEGKSQQRLSLKIIPRESRPFDLAVRWDYRPVSTQAAIEVQEAKLAIHLEGPREVIYGHKDLYKVRVSNSGTGDAENTLLKLTPAGGGEQLTASHNFGTIAPGEEKEVEVELTSHQVGNLTIKLAAECAGGTRTEIAEPLLVRCAKLQIDIDGPKLQYADTAGAYHLRISNPGTSPARQITVCATLPLGAKDITSTEKGEILSNNQMVWKIDTLAPTAEKIIDLKCILTRAGGNRMEVTAKADDNVNTMSVAQTQVDTMANLVLEVSDPPGPIALGNDVAYELRISNRGTSSADRVDVAAFFSQGIEPIRVEGLPHRISVGQVNFGTIPTLAPGQELRVKIVARAQTAGSHIFRAELHCQPLGTRLVREETTHFFACDNSLLSPSAASMAGGTPPINNMNSGSLRTADRRYAEPPLSSQPAPQPETIRPSAGSPR